MIVRTTARPTSPQTTSLPAPLSFFATPPPAGTSGWIGGGGAGRGPAGSVAGGGTVGSATGKGHSLGHPGIMFVAGHGPSHHHGFVVGKASGGQGTSCDHHIGAGGGHATLSGQHSGFAGHGASMGQPAGGGGGEGSVGV